MLMKLFFPIKTIKGISSKQNLALLLIFILKIKKDFQLKFLE